MNVTARLYLVFFCCASLSAPAIEIKLKKPYLYRKESYQTFNTEDLNLSALLALQEATRETEPKQSQEIAGAIAAQQYKKATNVVYFDPPFTHNEEVFHQLYLYQGRESFRDFLAGFLKALERSPHRAAYTTAMNRIMLRLRAPQKKEKAKTEKPPKVRKTRKRPRAQEIVEERERVEAREEGGEPKRAAVETAQAQREPEPDLPILLELEPWAERELEECDRIMDSMFAPASGL